MSEKYFVTAQTLPHDFFVVTHVPNVDGPTKALLDTIRAKVDEMIRAGKAVKGTLGTVEHPHLPGGELDRKSTRLNSSHSQQSRMPSSA